MNYSLIKRVRTPLALASIFSLLLSVVMTAINWHNNPAELFYRDEQTQWQVVFETFYSWFAPSLLIVIPLFILVGQLYFMVKEALNNSKDK